MTFDLVVLGASLGGLDALGRILGALPADFPTALAVAQHRRPDAHSQLAHLLNRQTQLTVREADDKDVLEAGSVYLAPADYHLLVEPGRLALTTDEPVSFARPSIDVLFESAAEAYGRRLVAVLLTAASEDGAEGMVRVVSLGGVAVVQDPATARSPIAPLAALARTRVHHVLPLKEIGPLLTRLAARR